MKKGFTLIELIVSLGLFAIIMTIAAGAYLTMIHVNQQAQALSSGIDNLSFALENMSRSIRSGSQYDCGTTDNGATSDCSGGLSSFFFTDQDGTTRVGYRYNNSNGSIERSTNGGPWIPLTDSSVVQITSLEFYATGTAHAPRPPGPAGPPGDYLQPYVTITVSGSVSAGHGVTQPFTVETSAAWRGSDL